MYNVMTKTVAVSESTWQRLRRLMKQEHAKDLDELINRLIQKSEKIPSSMFGLDGKLHIKYTEREHEEFGKDLH